MLNYQWGDFPLKNKENVYEQIKLKLITVTMPMYSQLQSERLKQRNAHTMQNLSKTIDSEKQSSFKSFESPSMLFALFLPLCKNLTLSGPLVLILAKNSNMMQFIQYGSHNSKSGSPTFATLGML